MLELGCGHLPQSTSAFQEAFMELFDGQLRSDATATKQIQREVTIPQSADLRGNGQRC